MHGRRERITKFEKSKQCFESRPGKLGPLDNIILKVADAQTVLPHIGWLGLLFPERRSCAQKCFEERFSDEHRVLLLEAGDGEFCPPAPCPPAHLPTVCC